MTVFKATVAPVQSDACHHVRVALHVGESETSLQFSGIVVLRPEEVEEFLALVNGPPEEEL
jgi:hypothetical protein